MQAGRTPETYHWEPQAYVLPSTDEMEQPSMMKWALVGFLSAAFLTFAAVVVVQSGMLPYPHPGSETLECLKTEFIRVQIGDKYFSIPRKDIYLLQISAEGELPSAGTFCQRREDAPLKAKEVGFKIVPLPCDSESDCYGKKMHVRLSPAAEWDTDRAVLQMRDSLRKYCKPQAAETGGEAHGMICRSLFVKDEMVYWIQFRYVPYPPAHINETERLVAEYIRKNYEIPPSLHQ